MRIESEAEMIAFAEQVAEHVKAGDVLCLKGALGVGKSVFARALIRKLHDDPDMDVPSPSFTLVQTYETDTQNILHMDAYRLSSEDEVIELGWPEIINDYIVILEWPERLGDLTPAKRIDIEILDRGEDAREVKFEQIGDWHWALSGN